MNANNNQGLIDGLRLAADFLESKPEFPKLSTLVPQYMYLRVWDKDALKEAARQLGSFEKKFSDLYFELHRKFTPEFEIQVTIGREEVCKKIVTWDCPDDESLLKLVEQESA